MIEKAAERSACCRVFVSAGSLNPERICPVADPHREDMAMFVRGPLLTFCLATLSAGTANVRAEALAPADTGSHIGQVATVCGLVASTNYAPQSNGAPTFLDFGSAYPHAVFTVLILGGDRAKFGEPEKTLRGKQVCVTGQIRLYGGTAQMILTQPDQLFETGSVDARP